MSIIAFDKLETGSAQPHSLFDATVRDQVERSPYIGNFIFEFGPGYLYPDLLEALWV